MIREGLSDTEIWFEVDHKTRHLIVFCSEQFNKDDLQDSVCQLEYPVHDVEPAK